MTKNILDQNGNVIGSLTLPDSTTDAQWAAALAPYANPAPLPDVTPRQMRQALVLSGVDLSTIDSTIASLPSPLNTLVQIEWDYSIAFQRDNPYTAQIAAMLGWTSAQLDALWELAATL
jgi:hypothetical protein